MALGKIVLNGKGSVAFTYFIFAQNTKLKKHCITKWGETWCLP
jgi:hypothetical protein